MKLDTWYCAGWSSELTREPIGRRLLGRHVVLFRDGQGTARALGGRCPHRGADLAQGTVVDGCIQCPFHGWRFDGVGQCAAVPSQPTSVKLPLLARVPSFPLAEREGTLWMWASAAGTPPADLVPQTAPPARRLRFDPQLLAAPFLNALENLFDKAHVPFIHGGTFGPGQSPLVARQRIVVEADGRALGAEDDPDGPWRAGPTVPRGVSGQLARLLGFTAPRVQRTRFDVVGGAQLYLEYPNGTFDLFLTHLTPADEERTWLFVESLRTRAPHAVGDWIQRRVLRRLFEEGRRETTLILAAAPEEVPRPVSVEADRLGLAARRLYERWACGAGTPAGDREAVVDR